MVATDKFVVTDTGNKKEFSTGMVRNSNANKVRYDHLFRGPMFKRWAAHTWKAEKFYPDAAPQVSNWQLAETVEELDRGIESFIGHVVDYMDSLYEWLQTGVESSKEDNAAAVYFNINLIENIKLNMAKKKQRELDKANSELWHDAPFENLASRRRAQESRGDRPPKYPHLPGVPANWLSAVEIAGEL